MVTDSKGRSSWELLVLNWLLLGQKRWNLGCWHQFLQGFALWWQPWDSRVSPGVPAWGGWG